MKNQNPKIIVYCHTPIRYYWSHAKEYEDMMEFGILNPFVKFVFRLVKGWMQKVDYAAAQKVDYFVANSKNTAERIKKYYNRDSEVIYPGVELLRHPEHREGSRTETTGVLDSSLQQPYYLGLGRCIPYKRFDLLVEAFNQNGRRLILCTATDTKLYHELKNISGLNIEWKFRVSNEEKYELMKHAKAFLFPPEEDFGLVPVEAMLAGTPVIAYGKGGATESIKENVTGVFFHPQTAKALTETIENFEMMHWERHRIHEHALEFTKEKFQKNFQAYFDRIIGIQ